MEERLDLREKGGIHHGERQVSDTRLFMQLLAYGGGTDVRPLAEALQAAGLPSVLYADVNDPRGVGLLTWNTNPDFFATALREFLLRPPFAALTAKPEYTMFGRTYALGHEPNLEDWLVHRTPRVVTNPASPWGVWYPLRRLGAFSALPPSEQGPILSEHGKIGHQFGEAGYAQDVRLACFGIDKNDSDFVIGLIGGELFPLSACVQAMRKTRQTSQFIQAMGPFFIGRAAWQGPLQKG